MTVIFAIVNQKGGVGKTTTAINLATSLTALKKKVLLVDLDPQGNATTGLGVQINRNDYNIYHVMVGEKKIDEVIHHSSIPNLEVVPATMDLTGAEVELVSKEGREKVLNNALSEFAGKYDYIFIDCPPSLGLLTVNALMAASKVLIPLQTEYFALEGLSHLAKTIKIIQGTKTELEIQGILLTMYDVRNKLTKRVEEEVRGYYGGLVYSNVIPRNVKVSEAPSHGYPVIVYDPNSVGAKSYLELAKEFLNREGM